MASGDDLLRKISDFFASDQWWSPVLDFMLSNCEPFSRTHFSVQQYQIFLEFEKLVTNLVEGKLCQSLQLSPDIFEEIILVGIEQNNPQARTISQTIKDAFNFPQFSLEMHAHNERIEQEVSQVMQKVPFEMPNNVPRFEIKEPSPAPSGLPPIESARNPRFSVKQPTGLPKALTPRFAINAEMAQRGHSQLPAILSHKKETLQTMNSGVPSIKVPKQAPAKLPPLGKSPRF